MTCHEIEPDIVDLARGVTGDPRREAEIARHLASCPRCARTLDAERAMSAALRRLAEGAADPGPDPRTEAAILAAFDRAWAGPKRRGQVQGWLAVAAAVLLAVGATGLWLRVNRVPQPPSALPGVRTDAPASVAAASVPPPSIAPPSIAPPSEVSASVVPASVVPGRLRKGAGRPVARPGTPEFVPWPGAASLPSFESGELMRLELPASVLPSLGLFPPASRVDVVQADVLIGQDGFARAVRLVP